MQPINFPEANATFGPPKDMEGRCDNIKAFCGHVEGGSNDGQKIVVTAWKPNTAEMEQLKRGQPIFISFVGGLPPHFVTTTFNQAIHPA